MPFVYILRCADGSLYVGVTEHLDARVRQHEDGRASTFTCSRRPVSLVHVEEHSRLAAALERERQLKGWTREKKEALISGDMDALRGMAFGDVDAQGPHVPVRESEPGLCRALRPQKLPLHSRRRISASSIHTPR